MIDDLEKSVSLVERMRAALPMRAVAGEALRRTLQERSERVFPRRCRVTEVSYLGDEGGVACTLDFGIGDGKDAHIVSITHLGFDRGNPLAREIGAYRKRRIKRLEKLHRGELRGNLT